MYFKSLLRIMSPLALGVPLLIGCVAVPSVDSELLSLLNHMRRTGGGCAVRCCLESILGQITFVPDRFCSVDMRVSCVRPANGRASQTHCFLLIVRW